MKIGKTFDEVMTKHRTFPKIAFVEKAKDYKTSQNITIEGSKIDILARILSLGKLHHTFTATGLLSLGACTAVIGSIPNQLLSNKP
jgi:2-methylaconitate cis-trans-isomerase PrpF